MSNKHKTPHIKQRNHLTTFLKEYTYLIWQSKNVTINEVGILRKILITPQELSRSFG